MISKMLRILNEHMTMLEADDIYSDIIHGLYIIDEAHTESLISFSNDGGETLYRQGLEFIKISLARLPLENKITLELLGININWDIIYV